MGFAPLKKYIAIRWKPEILKLMKLRKLRYLIMKFQ